LIAIFFPSQALEVWFGRTASDSVQQLTHHWEQIELDDPDQEWEIVNAWFVKQKNFRTRFRLRELVMPDKAVAVTA